MFTQAETQNLIQEALDAAKEKLHLGKYEIAVVLLEQILKIEPDNLDSLQLLGTSYHALKRYQDAKKCFERSYDIDPNDAETINNIAVCYSAECDFEKSIDLLKKAISLKPDSPALYANLGLQYRHIEDYAKAIECYESSLKLKILPTTLGMLGGCYGEMKQLDIAENYIRQAIELDPSFSPVHIDLASILHLKGDLAEGFKEYEHRFDVFDQLKIWKQIFNKEKLWDGRDITGQKLMVHTEQGNGDAIHFVRYCKLLKEMNIHIILYCSEVLAGIFKELADEIYTTDPLKVKNECPLDFPEYDWYCSIISLPHLLKNPPIPSCPYLFAKKKVDMSAYLGKYKIGVAWGGNPQHPNDRYRSCKLINFKKIHDLPNVKLFSLMKDYRARTYDGKKIIDLSEDAQDMNIVDMSPMMQTYEDTASIVDSMDLLLSVDTSIVHLAGAMAKTVLCLLPENPDWRWGLDKSTTVWYPTVNFIRQKTRGDWADVFDEAYKQIKKACENSHAP